MSNSEAIKLILGWIGFVSITGLFLGFTMSIGWHLWAGTAKEEER